MEQEDKNLNPWQKIDKYLKENTESSFKVAIIEANKIFEEALLSKNLPGKNIKEKLSDIKEIFDDLEKIKKARKTFVKIIKEFDYSPSPETTKETLTVFYQATLDLEEVKPKKFTALKNFLKKKSKINFKKTAKKIIIALFLFFLLVLFLADTPSGNRLTEIMVNITHFFFQKIVPIILIITGLFVIVVGTLFYLEKRKRDVHRLIKKERYEKP